MSETDPGSLSTSQMELAVTIINSPPPSPVYAKSPVLAMGLPHLSSITHIIVILQNLQH